MQKSKINKQVMIVLVIFVLLLTALAIKHIRSNRQAEVWESNKVKQFTTDKILASEVTVEECKIKLNTTKGEKFVSTGFFEANPQTNYQFVLNQVAPSGKYVAFQDVSGGVDSMIRVYSIGNEDTVQLDVLGTSNIFDFKFLPDDRLVVLFGYRGIYNEQYVKVYDIASLFTNYPVNVDRQYKYFTNLVEHSRNLVLPNIGKDYYSLSVLVGDNNVKIYGSNGSDVLKIYGFDELLIK